MYIQTIIFITLKFNHRHKNNYIVQQKKTTHYKTYGSLLLISFENDLLLKKKLFHCIKVVDLIRTS